MISIIDKDNLGLIGYRHPNIKDVIFTQYWSPSLFSNEKRSNDTFESCEYLVLDVDSGFTLEQAKEEFKDYIHIIATSKSHQKQKNGIVCDRYRVILFFHEPITNKEVYSYNWSLAKELWPFIDPQCKDPARFYYPSIDLISSNDGYDDGILIEVLPLPVEIITKKVTNPTNNEQKGDLYKTTLEFLKFGAEPGEWHGKFIKAAANLREQNYSYDEAYQLLEEVTGQLDKTDIFQLKDIYKRPNKFEYRPKEENVVTTSSYVRLSDLFNASFEYLSDKEKIKGDATGLDGLDYLLGGGFRTGEITVLMAQAKTGKNTLYHHLMHKMLKRGIAIGYASRELTPETEVLPNLYSLEFEKNAWKEEVTEEYRQNIMNTMKDWPLYFAPGYGLFPLEDLNNWIYSLYKIGVRHFWIDHLHYMLEDEDPKLITKFMYNLKKLVKEIDIHINLIVQPKFVQDGQMLQLNSLRGSVAIGQTLDNLLILERVRGQDSISQLRLEVGRHKLCRPGKLYLQYNHDTTAFMEVEKEQVTEAANNYPPVQIPNVQISEMN